MRACPGRKRVCIAKSDGEEPRTGMQATSCLFDSLAIGKENGAGNGTEVAVETDRKHVQQEGIWHRERVYTSRVVNLEGKSRNKVAGFPVHRSRFVRRCSRGTVDWPLFEDHHLLWRQRLERFEDALRRAARNATRINLTFARNAKRA